MMKVWGSMQADGAARLRSFSGDHDHPVNTKLIFEHSVAGRPECRTKRHRDLTALGESVEDAIAVGFVGDRDCEAEGFKLRFVVAAV